MWTNCLMNYSRKKGILNNSIKILLQINKNYYIGGRKQINNALKRSIDMHLQNNSSIAANRFLKKQACCVRYRDGPLTQAFGTFPEKNLLSFSSFNKYVDCRYKKPHRFSDLCGFCEKNKVKR